MKKWIAVAVLALAVTARAQAPVTETLGGGTPSRTCATNVYACVAPVLDAEGQPDGTIDIFDGSKTLQRYALDGSLTWTSTDYDGTNFTHDGLSGSLTYTLASKTVRCGGSGRWIYTCRYNWVSGGSLTE